MFLCFKLDKVHSIIEEKKKHNMRLADLLSVYKGHNI